MPLSYQLVWLDPIGDAHVLVTATIHPMLFAQLCFRVADLARFIPGLAVVTLGHQVTQLTFTRNHYVLRGEAAHYAISDN